MPSLTGKRNFLSFIAGVGVGEVLPFAALEAVHLLGAVEPLADGVGFRVELAEFVVDKGVDSADVGTHTVGWQALDWLEKGDPPLH